MVRHLKKIIAIIFAIPLVLVGVMFFIAEVHYSRQDVNIKCEDQHSPIQGQEIVDRFSQALRIKTITKGMHDYDTAELLRFHDFLQTSKHYFYT